MRTRTAMVTAITIGVVVIVFPVVAAATIDAAIWTRCHRCNVWAPIGGVINYDDAIVADAPEAPRSRH